MIEINRNNLKIGKLYFIECLTTTNDNILIKNKNFNIMVGIFEGFNLIQCNFVKPWNETIFYWFNSLYLKNINNDSEINNIKKYKVHLNYFWRFYEIEKFKIQSNMEMRAINKILKKITGDEYIEWV